MRFDRDLMIFKALCALSEYADASHAAPLKPTFGLRFALAFLYSQGNGDPRAFTDFWSAVQNAQDDAYHPTAGQYLRSTNARTALNGIVNSLSRWKCPGTPYTMIAEARSMGNADQVFRTAREKEARQIAEWEARDRERREAREKSKDCGYL